jgi:hypothetical protein
MALSRKRRKELDRLKRQAEHVWEDQKELLDHAAKVVREASRQAQNFAREEVRPRVKDAYEDRIVPAVGAGIAGARSAAGTARDKFAREVLPSVTSALGTALAALEVAKDRQVREAISRATKLGSEIGAKTGLVKPRPAGPGRYILIGLGVVAVAAVAYATWQTLRADDDLWIEDEPVETTPDSALEEDL